MKTIEQLENLIAKRNEYILSIYEQKLQKEEQLSRLKDEYTDLQKKMVLNPNVKTKAKLEEKRKEVRECEEQYQNAENDIKEFENSIFDIAPYKQAIIDEYHQEAKGNISEQIERLKQAKQAYEDEAAELVECVRVNKQLRSKVLLVLDKTRPGLQGIELTMNDEYFAPNIRNQKINEYIENEIQRVQAALNPFILGNADRSDIEPRSIYHYDFLGNLI